MRLLELELRNFCQYREFQHVFHPGMTGILGPNGVGKSNLVNSVRFAITGSTPNAGNKNEDVYWNAPKGAPAYVRLKFKIGADELEVCRFLQGGSTELRVNNFTPITGESAVTDEILKWGGLTSQQLAEIVWVPQDEILGFIDEAQSKRNELLQKICGLEEAAVAHEQLGRYRNTLTVPEFGLTRDALDRDRTQILEEQRRLLDGQRLLPDAAPLEEAVQKWAATVSAAKQRDQTLERLVQVRSEIDRVDKLCAVNESTKLQRQSELGLSGITEAVVTAMSRQLTDDVQRLSSLQTAEQKAVLADKERRQIQEMASHAASRESAIAAAGDITAKQARVAQISAELKSLAEGIGYAKHLASHVDNVDVCPTCLTPKAGFADRLEEAKQLLVQHQQTTERLNPELKQLNAEIADYNVWQTELRTTNQQLQLRKNAFVDYPHPDPTELSTVQQRIKQTEQQLQAYRDGQAELQNWQQSIDKLRHQRSQLSGSAAELDANLQAILRQFAFPVEEQPLHAILDAEASAKRELLNLRSQQDSYRYQLQTVENRLSLIDQSIQQALEIERRQVAIRNRISVVERAQALMHKDAAPRLVLEQCMADIADRTNTFLELFEAPFRVRVGHKLNFDAVFFDGKVQSARRLSPGLKVVLALSARVALHRMRAGNLNLICLDEPTVWLDHDRVKAVHSVLNRLHDYTTQQGLQVVIVTHEASLAPLFDSTIQL